MQVEWDSLQNEANADLPQVPVSGGAITDILTDGGSPDMTVTAVPLQFHFHSYSEHTIDGMHVRPGCAHAACPASCT